ncbi:MAG TPA: radical SAM protein [Syntrophales bacterium]|nr:radical SAM protein [Syntrophales bacterium]HOS78468.1 radical SAM protein [Syntrophales bacterium]
MDILESEAGYLQKGWDAHLKVCLAFPNAYRTGMSNLGFQTVYEIVNHHPAFLCERAFLPPAEGDEPARPGGPLLSVESGRPLKDFDIVAFSVPFENDYPNILAMLAASRIPLLAAERKPGHPLVVGGGVAFTLNPEPTADFFDLYLLGEGESLIPRFLAAFAEAESKGVPRGEFLAWIQRSLAGAYVPGLYRPDYGPDGLLRGHEPLDAAFPRAIRPGREDSLEGFVTQQVISAQRTEFGAMHLAEVNRGCGRGCRFCAAGHLYRPPRFRSLQALAPAFARGIAAGRKIGLLGTAVSDHPQFRELCRRILDQEGRFAISSLRADRIDAETAQLLARAGAETVSLAPETGSQRLRDVIRKGITEEDLFHAAESLLGQGIVNLRLYFMVGLPTETDDDVDAIVRLVKKVKHHAAKIFEGKKRFRLITVSVNQFVPKPATPFQWLPLEDIRSVKGKIARLNAALRREGAVKVIHDLPKWNYVQALLSLGDRRVGSILLAVHRREGNWSQTFKETSVNPDFFVYREKTFGEFLPWDFIDHGTDRVRLWRECQAALGR